MSRIGYGLVLVAITELVTISECSEGALAGTQLPVPCSAGACATNAGTFVASGTATAVQSGKNLTVKQTSNNAALNWASFNISADGKVVFQQPTKTSVALNRIYDANPSSIFGSLSANGQIYLLNANGFLFGSTSTVNVSGMIASSLNISDQTFASGILAPVQSNKAALQPWVDGSNQPIANSGVITLEKGAQLTATGGGRLLLAAPSVQNSGTLSAPDGQIVLAAGQSIYLQASSQPDLRGLIVQVDGEGTAANQLTGLLSAPRGNITLTGLMVNQDGRISATTTVSANGSVTLEAANTVKFNGTDPITAVQGGQVELGAGSRIDVMPEYADTHTAVDAQAQLQSAIDITGQQVFLHGASIVAPSGKLTVTASANPDAGVTSGGNPQARIRIDSGTTIDLSGSDAELPMSANLVTVQLRSNELKDDPAQRNAALRGQTVTVDARANGGAGTPIADVTSAIASVGKNIAQRTEAGGTATFLSEGDVVFKPGASLDVSGGATNFLGGSIQTTQLIGANGQLYDIGSANPLQSYTGVVNPTFTQIYDKWGVKEVVATPGLSHYEAGYQQGAAAGSVQFAAPSILLGGALKATALSGLHQRGPVGTAFGDAAPGGTLTIGLPGGAGGGAGFLTDYLAPAIVITDHSIPIVVADNAALPPQTLQLPSSILTSDGFSTAKLYSNSTFSLPSGLPLQLPAGSTLQVAASRLDIDSNITDLGGRLSFASVLSIADQDANAPTLGPGYPRIGVGVGDGVILDVSGQWTNDGVSAGGKKSGATLQNAGSINLQTSMPGSELVLGDNVSLKADGGAWLQSSGALAYGKGGAITLDASPAPGAVQFGRAVSVEGFGAGTAAGGSFALTAPRIDIAQGSGGAWTDAQRVDDVDSPGGVLHVYAPLFSNYGFSSIALTATGAALQSAPTDDVLSVLSGTKVVAQSRSLQLNSGYQSAASGGTLKNLSHVITLPDYLRPATNVSLSVLREADDFLLGSTGYGALDVQQGASILADPGASIGLMGEGSISVGGTLRAPGGNVTVQLLSPGLYNPSTAGLFDPGYQAGLGITLESTSIIDVSGGSAVYTPNTQGLLFGTVRSGGAVDIGAQRGTVLTETGSLIDISGSSATFDIANPGRSGSYNRQVVASAGGSLTVGSVESIALLGSINGKAGTGSSGQAAAGSLEVDLTRFEVIENQPNPYGLPMEIDIVGSTVGTSPTPRVNLATIGIAQIQSSGIDSLILRAGGQTAGNINIETNQSLSLGREIIFDTHSLSVADGFSAHLAAPYVAIGNSQPQGPESAPPAVAGTGKLAVDAQQLTLFGNWALQEIASATFTSQGDVQLQGVGLASGPETGSLVTAGNLTINAARVYPDTFTSFSIKSENPGNPSSGTVTIGQSSASPGLPLSAGGSLSISADDIVISGTLLAPFGHIDLSANDSLTLADGSLVSVSGAGLNVPFGQTQEGGRQWIYTTPGGVATITGVPGKEVSLTAPKIQLQPASTVDLQGGGNLYAYEWVPGTGGSKDLLAGSGKDHVAGLYAILPSQRGQAAPFDPQESGSFDATQTVYISGGAGLAAGYYALLPPRYALQPGALLIQIEPKYVSANGGQIGSLADGTPVVAGYLSSGTTGLHTGLTEYQGFAIYPGSYAQQLAAYGISNASAYFGAIAAQAGNVPAASAADAGSLTFSVVKSLNNSFELQGKVRTAAAKEGSGALVNISAPDLEITSGTEAASAGSIAVSSEVLQGWNSSQLILGGTAAPGGTGSTGGAGVIVTAGTVTVDSGVQLTADQILLVAQQSIDLKSGASLSSTSGKAGSVLKTLPALEALTLWDAAMHPLDGAGLLAVSDLALPVVTRASNVAGATITLESGSTLSSGGALALDAPGAISMAGTVSGKGASWSLSSSSVGILGSGNSTDALNINSNILAGLQQAGSVRIASQGALDLYAPVTLGAASAGSTPTLKSLTLIGTELNNQATGDSVFGASTLTLGGATAPAGSASAGNGGLTLVADTLNIGPGTLAVNGFAHTLAQVSGAVTSTGTGGIIAGGGLTVNAVELAPGPGSQTAIAASGTLSIGAPTTLRTGTKLPTSVGGALALTGNSIVDAGVIAAPSGVVSLSATGGDLDLRSTASINTAGTLLLAVNRSAASPGGIINLNATGNVLLEAGSKLDVSGKQMAPAGALAITSGGSATLAGTLTGDAGTGGTGGSFLLDAGQLLGGLTPLASSLMSGGFNKAVDVRVHSGDLDLSSAIAANAITLTADTGAVNIAGVLTATSGAQRGQIDLSGGTGVILAATAQLHADGAGSGGRGGDIEINSICPSCTITLSPGSVITTSGTAQMGELVLRAPALAATNDVAINVGAQGIGADVSRVGQVIIEPTLVFATSGATVDSDLATDVGTASAYLTAASPVIAARLTSPGTASAVQVGVELQDASVNDPLTIHSFDLSAYSAPAAYGLPQDAQVINLSVRSAGSIAIQGAISDGFYNDYNTGLIALTYAVTGPTTFGPAPSGSLSFVAGADLQGANPLSVLKASTADLTLLTSNQQPDGTTDGIGPSVVRTGTGDINLIAARDVIFQAGTSAYTGGEAPADVIQPVAFRGPHGQILQNFGENGGDVRISAARDVVGSPVGSFPGNDNYSVAGWQVRQGNAQNPSQYGIDFVGFDWNIGALEGGDVSVTAGRDVINVSAATADSLVSGANTYSGNSAYYQGGGGLDIRAGGNIGSAQVYVADGIGTLTAGGGLIASQNVAANINASQPPVGTSIALGNSQVSVWARNGVLIDAIYNPTMVLQASSPGQYFTYGSNSGVSLSSTAGDIALELNPTNGTMGALLGNQTVFDNTAALLVLPANLAIQALQDNINLNINGFNGAAFLFPSSTGQLSLFAGNSIAGQSATGGLSGFAMSDSPAASFPTVADPGIPLTRVINSVSGLVQFGGVIHDGDANPALITAGQDIDNLYLSIPKAGQVVAGRDVVNLQYRGQNLSSSDDTLIVAGRDVIAQSSFGNTPGVRLGGPGSFTMLAGRDIDLGFGSGIITVGNFDNANLPSSQGADLTVLAGYGSQGADVNGFLKQVIEKSKAYQGQLTDYVETVTDTSGLTFAQAEAEFAGFSNSQRSVLVDNVFFNELLVSGRAANSGTGVGFAQGYAAIDALFPGSRTTGSTVPSPYGGDLTLTSSQIYTANGGNISLLVPGGKIDVGLANPPPNIAPKPASQLGIVAEGTGNVSIYTQGDVNVNQSRIFTLGGGNILIWSDQGSIDAGNGSKSSLSVPPPVVLISADGTVSLNFAGALAAGSGIRTIQTSADVPPGNVDLDAPVGTVNAGDAGIGASGNINIAAAHVIGLDNINFGGTATGVPSDISNLGAALSGVSSVASSATSNAEASVGAQSNAAKDVAPLAQTALSWLDVFVTGLGEENCKPNDIECLKRQKTASP
jgi:filamentous hemagglutinin